MKHSIDESPAVEATGSAKKKFKKLKTDSSEKNVEKSHQSKRFGQQKLKKVPSKLKSNKNVTEVSNETNNSSALDSEDVVPKKKFKFKNKLGEKKGIKGTFSPKKAGPKVSTEVDKKEQRKKQKLLKKQRREKERKYAVPDEAKKIFEEMRCHKCPTEKRVELSQDLFKILTGKISSAAKSHELARMIQWLIKVGSPQVKENVINEIINDTVVLCTTRYSNHIVLTILKDCDKGMRKRLLNYFIGNISTLASNKFSAPVIDEYYSKYAKSSEKAFMRQELYSDLFKGGRNRSLTCLSAALSENPTLSSVILKGTKNILSKLVSKDTSLGTNLVADVLYDYLQNCEEQDKLDVLEILKSNVQTLLKTSSGKKALMFLLWESTAKIKKAIVKELKTQVIKIAKSDGNIFLRSLFDSVDDTVLIKKAIIPTILENVEELVKDANGRKVILYLVAHRDTAYFHPKELDILKKADESTNVKKDISVKEKEVLAPCIEAVLNKIKENPEFWFSEASIAVVSLAALRHGEGDALLEAYQAVAEYVTRSINEDNFKVVEDAGIHMNLKKLIKNDVESSVESKFSELLISSFSSDTVDKLVTFNRGCFLLVVLIETNFDMVLNKIMKLFKKTKILKKLENQDSKGSEVLKKIISEKNLV